MKTLLMAAAHVVAILVLWGGTSEAQKPEEVLITQPSPQLAPESTLEFLELADAVVSSARVGGHSFRVRKTLQDSPYPILGTVYSLHVTDVLKQSAQRRITGHVSVLLPGGEWEGPDRKLIVRQCRIPSAVSPARRSP